MQLLDPVDSSNSSMPLLLLSKVSVTQVNKRGTIYRLLHTTAAVVISDLLLTEILTNKFDFTLIGLQILAELTIYIFKTQIVVHTACVTCMGIRLLDRSGTNFSW